MNRLLIIIAASLVTTACATDDREPFGPPTDMVRLMDGGAATPDAETPADPDPPPADPGPAPGTPPAGPPVPGDLRCGATPPPGAVLPSPLPRFTGGACPTLDSGRNTLRSGGAEREFLLVFPTDYSPTETLPLVVMWHHLGGSASSLEEHGQVQASVDSLRFIAAIPEKKGDLNVDVVFSSFDMVWPYLDYAPMSRMEEEAVFFDDMIACIAEQFPVDESCISTAGVSAGALWSAQLAQLRAERLASVVLLSGGVGPATTNGFIDVHGWRGASHRMPVLVGWGGRNDACGADFDRASQNAAAALDDAGHFVMECVHNCGHAAPPVDPMVGLPVLWRFALDHPYWLRDGESPYASGGMPSGVPSWCALGAGAATPRTEACGVDGFGGESCPVPAL